MVITPLMLIYIGFVRFYECWLIPWLMDKIRFLKDVLFFFFFIIDCRDFNCWSSQNLTVFTRAMLHPLERTHYRSFIARASHFFAQSKFIQKHVCLSELPIHSSKPGQISVQFKNSLLFSFKRLCSIIIASQLLRHESRLIYSIFLSISKYSFPLKTLEKNSEGSIFPPKLLVAVLKIKLWFSFHSTLLK